METSSVLVLVLLGVAVGAALGWLLGRGRAAEQLARLSGERDLLDHQLRGLREVAEDDRRTAAELAPLRHALGRVEAQVEQLERDRQVQFGQVRERLQEVAGQAAALRDQTASLSGALNSSGVRGTWGEAQLRRLLEHAGMLARCDFDEQVGAVSTHEARVRPDVVVRLPGDGCLVVDSKAPLTAFLRAQAEDLSGDERAELLRAHARSLRGHVDGLAAKAYWSAFRSTPEMVVCFVPSDAVLAAALHADPSLYEDAMRRRVVLASPATLLALLRTVAHGWQQQALTESAHELLALGTELHRRLATLGRHVSGMGRALHRSVEAYNAMVGTLESRVMVTSRRLRDMGLTDEALETLEPLQSTPRPLTAGELIDDELAAVAEEPEELEDLGEVGPRATRTPGRSA
jgi:DNA recombination protein RmuC